MSHPLVQALLRLAPPEAPDRWDRAALAHLRRGLGKPPGTVPETYRYVERPFASFDPPASREEVDAGYIVASLFALHPFNWEPAKDEWNSSLGATLGSHARYREGSAEPDPGVERRFVAVLDAPRDEIPTHLRQLIALLHDRSPEARVDWSLLLRDLTNWDHPDRFVQRRWAEGFWRRRRESPAGGESAALDAASATDDTTE